MAKLDWYFSFIFLFILLSCIFFAEYYYVHTVNACIKSPLDYYVDTIKKGYGESYKVQGSVYIVGDYSGWVVNFGEDNKTTGWNNYSQEYIPLKINFNDIKA